MIKNISYNQHKSNHKYNNNTIILKYIYIHEKGCWMGAFRCMGFISAMHEQFFIFIFIYKQIWGG
jgi:hypothetical protein